MNTHGLCRIRARAFQHHWRTGFTRADAATTLLAVLLLVAVMAALFTPAVGKARINLLSAADASFLRELARAGATAQAFSGGRAALPSAFGAGASASAMNTSDRRWSMLLALGLVEDPDLLVSPAEHNPAIVPYARVVSDPAQDRTTVRGSPWLDGFSADLTANVCHVSYAHWRPTSAALRASGSWGADTPVMATRFPEVRTLTRSSRGDEAVVEWANPRSRALRMYRRHFRDSFPGNIAYADGHVVLEHQPLRAGKPMRIDEWRQLATPAGVLFDVPFYDEPEDPTGMNGFLGMFTTAGEHREDFTAVYD